MCLAIYKPAKAVIPVEYLQNGHEHNDDGCGFCYSESGKLHVEKGMWSFEEFYKKYQPKEHLPMLIHFRWGTSGGKNTLNCHPFSLCDGRYALIHNGCIPVVCSIKNLSDTGNFTKLVMEPMLMAGIHPKKPSFFFLVEEALGRGNKVCLMDSKGEVTIYNERAGQYEDAADKDGNPIMFLGKDGKKHNVQVWYSNSGYKHGSANRKRYRSSSIHDEYEGYFDGGASACGLAEVPTGFTGTPKPQLDPPPAQTNLPGFAAGTKPKSARESAEAIQNIYDAQHGVPPLIHREGKYPPNPKKETIRIVLPPKQNSLPAPPPIIVPLADTDNHNVTEITEGPIFDAKTELELAFLGAEMGMPRNEGIKYLELEDKDAVAVI